MFRCKYS